MSDIRVVFRTQSGVEANLVRGLLESHGIKALLSSDVPYSVFPLTIDGLGEVRISVSASDADEAIKIIEAQPLHPEMEVLESRLGYRFRDRGLLAQALTHTSSAHEDVTGSLAHNEGFEFLGDSFLGFAIARELFQRFPELNEGQMSKMKASLVSTPTLARLAADLELGRWLLLGRGEEKTGGREKLTLIADCFEAIIAAVYLDGGIDEAHRFVVRQFEPLFDKHPQFAPSDFKSALQELLQSRGLPLPEYRLVGTIGPDHRKTFRVEIWLQGKAIAQGEGSSKKEAEQAAAREALTELATLREPQGRLEHGRKANDK